MKKGIRALLAATMVVAGPVAAQGQQDGTEDSGLLRIGVAYFGVDGAEGAPAFELTYQTEHWHLWRTRLQVGGLASADGALYGYGGIVLPIPLPGSFRLTPSFGVGAYRQGHGPDLGSVLEFRSAIHLDRPIWRDDGLTLFLYHLSNASLGRRNPGTEVLGLGYVFRW